MHENNYLQLEEESEEVKESTVGGASIFKVHSILVLFQKS
jgi:hypothetical protein